MGGFDGTGSSCRTYVRILNSWRRPCAKICPNHSRAGSIQNSIEIVWKICRRLEICLIWFSALSYESTPSFLLYVLYIEVSSYVLKCTVKFIYSEKATKFWKISTYYSQNFVAFSEYINFKYNRKGRVWSYALTIEWVICLSVCWIGLARLSLAFTGCV